MESMYYQGKEDEGFIDLGLSLGTMQPQAYNPSGYDEVMGWTQENVCEEEEDGVQSKQKWAYVKVNMDGVVVGRKIYILDHSAYSTLALQLENMFGIHSASGLRLFQAGSEFCLFYKDRDDNWRTVGDVPWKEFVEYVKRIRIARRN